MFQWKCFTVYTYTLVHHWCNLEQFRRRFLAKGHFDMWSGRAEDQTILVSWRNTVPRKTYLSHLSCYIATLFLRWCTQVPGARVSGGGFIKLLANTGVDGTLSWFRQWIYWSESYISSGGLSHSLQMKRVKCLESLHTLLLPHTSNKLKDFLFFFSWPWCCLSEHSFVQYNSDLSGGVSLVYFITGCELYVIFLLNTENCIVLCPWDIRHNGTLKKHLRGGTDFGGFDIVKNILNSWNLVRAQT